MSLVASLMQSSGGLVDTSKYDQMFTNVNEGFLDNCFLQLTSDIYAVDEAYLTADIIGSVKVIREGADPAALMESMLSSAIDKLKAAWTKFLAGIKAFFNKVVDFFKSLVLSGKKFVKEFGDQISSKAKSNPNWEWNGYSYNVEAGNKATDTHKKNCDDMIGDVLGKFSINDAAQLAGSNLVDAVTQERVSGGFITRIPALNAVKEKIDKIEISEVKDDLREAYRGGDTSKSKQSLGGENGAKKMMDFISTAKGAVSTFQSEKRTFETQCNNVIGKLDKFGRSNKNGDDAPDSKIYKYASEASALLKSIMNVRKSVCDVQIAMYREICRAYTGALKMFLNFGKSKAVSDSTIIEADDIDVEDMDDIEVDEAAIDGADEPEGDTKDIGIVKEGCGKKCAAEEGCKGDDDEDPLEEAMRYL